MRAFIYLILFSIVLIAPFILRMALIRSTVADHAASAGRLVVVTPNNQDIRNSFRDAFNAWHIRHFGRSVEIDFITPGGTGDIKRLLETTYNAMRGKETGELPPESQAIANIDLVWGGGDFFFNNELKPRGILQPLEIDPDLLKTVFPEHSIAGVRLYDHAVNSEGELLPPHWIGVCLSSFGIVYNPDIYQSLGLPDPEHWHDLTNPKLSGMIALADPTHSGSAAVAYMVVIQRAMADAEEAFFDRATATRPAGAAPVSREALMRTDEYQQAIEAGWKKGMGELLLIAANARYFSASASQVPNDVGNGEAAVGMCIDFYGRVYQESVGPERCKFISPIAATVITPDPIAILYGVKGEQQTLARRFVEFQLTPEAQRLWILKPGIEGGPAKRGLRRPPIRRDVYADRTGWSDEVDPFTEAGGFNQRGEWMTLFTDTRPLWAAAWIDSREALKSAYQRILRVEDVARRDQLIAELADLPITMRQVAELRAERRKHEALGDADEWKARQRIESAKSFRAHYADVAAKARQSR